MIRAQIKILAICLVLTSVTSLSVSAQPRVLSNESKPLINLNAMILDAPIINWGIDTKTNGAYTEANDPSFHKSGPDWDGPQHGYFAVPLIFIGIAGVLLFFLGRDKD